MYFKTPTTSETGQRLEVIKSKGLEIHDFQVRMAEKYGFEEWETNSVHAVGRIQVVIFPKNHDVDLKLWRLDNRPQKKPKYWPRIVTRVGKAVASEFSNQPVVTANELNKCVGFDEGYSFGKRIGFNYNDAFFGFSVRESWTFTKPDDCIEITYTEYVSLFKNNDK
jgi:hypothetical protein